MGRPEELNDPKKFDALMENINTKLAIAAIPLRERALMSQALLSDELDYDVADDDSVYPQVIEWYKKRFPGDKIQFKMQRRVSPSKRISVDSYQMCG